MENKRNAVVRWGLTFGLIMAALGSANDIGSRLLIDFADEDRQSRTTEDVC